ncbi:aldo/keto reductase [Martelella limonii]|uniref:aldo/keto reductase n=1 Tax=Martelella limonii TaxID=1647649 RepID=UPI00157FEEA7|nr:aldo/keto reductase [Martelella limonii]
MRYNRLGNSGLKVSELCLGTMTFGTSEGIWKHIGGLDQNGADDLVKIAFDAGINFLDTANVYSEGRSEEITGQALKNLSIPRDQVVIASKVFGAMGEGVNQRGSSRVTIMSEVKNSLKRLNTDYIDLYQLHGFDNTTPIEETLEAMDTLVRHGHIRYVGVSNWAAWQIAKALGISERKGLAPIRSLQAYYTIAGRDLEREIVPMLRSEGVGLMVWSPLAGGFLSGKYDRDNQTDGGGRRVDFDFPPVDKERGFATIDVMRPIAEAKGVSVAQIALSWLLHQQAVTSVIVGAKRADQLNDNIASADITFTADEMEKLNAVSALPREYPGWMFERQSGNEVKTEPRVLK